MLDNLSIAEWTDQWTRCQDVCLSFLRASYKRSLTGFNINYFKQYNNGFANITKASQHFPAQLTSLTDRWTSLQAALVSSYDAVGDWFVWLIQIQGNTWSVLTLTYTAVCRFVELVFATILSTIKITFWLLFALTVIAILSAIVVCLYPRLKRSYRTVVVIEARCKEARQKRKFRVPQRVMEERVRQDEERRAKQAKELTKQAEDARRRKQAEEQMRKSKGSRKVKTMLRRLASVCDEVLRQPRNHRHAFIPGAKNRCLSRLPTPYAPRRDRAGA